MRMYIMVIGIDDKNMLCYITYVLRGIMMMRTEDDGDEDVHLAPHLAGQGVDGLEGDGLEEKRLAQSIAWQAGVCHLRPQPLSWAN